MVRVRIDADGVEIPVRVIPRAKRDEVAGERNGAVCVRLTAPPVEGAANKALVELIARAFGVPKADVLLTSGAKSRGKCVRVKTNAPDAVLQALARLEIETAEA